MRLFRGFVSELATAIDTILNIENVKNIRDLRPLLQRQKEA